MTDLTQKPGTAGGRDLARSGKRLGIQDPKKHPAALYVVSLLPGSRRSALYQIRKIARLLGSTPAELRWQDIGFEEVVALQAKLLEEVSPRTTNHAISMLRGVLRFCVRLGLMEREKMQTAVDLPRARGNAEPKGRALTSQELGRMFLVAKQEGGPKGDRDRALLAILYTCGLRRQECALLNLADFDDESVKVRGKGGKFRVLPIAKSIQPALLAWRKIRGDAEGPFFLSVTQTGKLGPRLTTDGIYSALVSLGDAAKVRRFSPHDIRRTFIGDIIDVSDHFTAQHLAGHASPQTTAGYDRRPFQRKKEAVEKLQVPLDEPTPEVPSPPPPPKDPTP